MNPYASFLGGRDPIEVIRATPAQLENLVQTIDAEALNRAPAPGKWSIREVLCHLADVEVSFAFRLRQALAEDRHVIQPFDQDKWAAFYRHCDAAAAVAVFSALRRWDLALIEALEPEAFAKTLNHPERGDMTIQVMIETRAGHDLNHLRQIEAIRV
jgi:uncharacterized damage-inducible protein DinB